MLGHVYTSLRCVYCILIRSACDHTLGHLDRFKALPKPLGRVLLHVVGYLSIRDVLSHLDPSLHRRFKLVMSLKIGFWVPVRLLL